MRIGTREFKPAVSNQVITAIWTPTADGEQIYFECGSEAEWCRCDRIEVETGKDGAYWFHVFRSHRRSPGMIGASPKVGEIYEDVFLNARYIEGYRVANGEEE